MGVFDVASERFEVKDELGRGGMGFVIEAFDRALGRLVAIKHILPDSPIAIARFAREARITARLEHPSIVPIHDVGRGADGAPFYVMRKIEGERLDKLVADRPFAERMAKLPAVLAACDAAAFAHARGIIHRDIKPSNILIGEFGESLLIDWGIAREIASDDPDEPDDDASGDRLTRAGAVAGTPGFMAPEQARGETLDARADVFALGATLFYVVSGELAYSSHEATALIDLAGANAPLDWSRLPTATPPELRAIIQKAMMADARERYPDAGAMASDLRRFVSGQLVGAYEYAWTERARRFVRRHRAAVGVAAAALVLLAGLAIVSFRQIVRERDAADLSRALAEGRAREASDARDALVVQHARQLLDRDPAAAVLVLRTLPATSSQWPQAAVIAASAASRGVPIGFETGRIASLAFSPDGARLFALEPDGQAWVIDMVTRSRRSLSGVRGWSALWIDDRVVAINHLVGLALIDTTSGHIQTLELPSAIREVASDGGATRVLTDAGKLYTLDATRTLVEIAAGVVDIEVVGHGQWVVGFADHAELWSGDARVRLPEAEGRVEIVIAGPDLIAVGFSDRSCAWRIGAAPSLWFCTSVNAPMAITEHGLYVNGRQIELVTELRRQAVANEPALAGLARTRDGVALSTPRGIAVVDPLGVQRIGEAAGGFTRLAISPDRRWLAAARVSGGVLIWDMTATLPRLHRIDRFGSLFDLSEDAVWFVDISERPAIVRAGRADGSEFRIDVVRHFLPSVDDQGAWLWLVPVDTASAGEVIDVRPLRTLSADAQHGDTSLSSVPLNPHDLGADALGGPILVRQDGTCEQLVGPQRWRELGKFPLAATLVAVGENHVVASGSSKVCTLARATGALACTSLPEKPSQHLVSPDGVVWLVVEKKLFRWAPDERAPRAVAVAPSVYDLAWCGDRLVALLDEGYAHLGEQLVPRVVMMEPMRWVVPGDRLYGLSRTGKLAAFDCVTDQSYELRMPALDTTIELSLPISGGKSLAVQARRRTAIGSFALIWESPVPTDAVALQRWLALATNATLAPAGETAVWP